MAVKQASTTSPTYTKSLVCRPSPVTVIGWYVSNCFLKIGIALT